jgi:acylpyruvate hydrolase
VVDSRSLAAELPDTLLGFIERAEHEPSLCATVAALAASAPLVPERRDLDLQPCLPRPGKIVCLGVNYHDHAKEGGNTVAEYPALFLRTRRFAAGPRRAAEGAAISDKMDYEAELALVIGRAPASSTRPMRWPRCSATPASTTCRCATTRSAPRNGPSARTSTPPAASARTWSRRRAAARRRRPAHPVAPERPGHAGRQHLGHGLRRRAHDRAAVAGLTLEAGDVIVMGTPGGVGYARTPPVWMKAGDTIEIDIEGIGVLSNPVV